MRVNLFTKGVFIALAHHGRCWERSDVPSPDLYRQRTQARAEVIGNYVYIDGGEVSQFAPIKEVLKYRGSDPVNSTLSIDLSKSWSASNATIRQLPKAAQVMNLQTMWKDGDSFWIWGGSTSYSAAVNETVKDRMWKFTTDGNGGGEWSQEAPTSRSIFELLVRTADSVYVSTPDSGFSFGGIATPWTELPHRQKQEDMQPIPNMLSYNLTTKTWVNESTMGMYSTHGTISGGTAVYIPTFGDNGLITILGGSTWAPQSWAIEDDQANLRKPFGWMDFRNLTFMDPVTKKWYWQKTTGVAPTPRSGHCSVGVEGNGTFDIFVFGGVYAQGNLTYDDVFVLSLPGFVWNQVQYDVQFPRMYHTCVVAGNRQMLSIGGMSDAWWEGTDIWPQGLGVFDMVSWEWGNDYDANAEKYESNKAIQDWYSRNDANSVEWSSHEVKVMFTEAKTSSGGSSSSGGASSGDTSGNGGGSKAPVGAIAGGVVGGVAALALVGFAVWFLRRRKRTATAHPPAYAANELPTGPAYGPVQLADSNERWGGVSPKTELPGSVGHTHELQGTGDGFVAELDGRQGPR